VSALPPVFIEFLGKSTGFMATARGVKAELGSVEREGGGSMAKLGGVGKAALMGIGVAAAVAAAKTVHMAADFQTQMTRVRTGAGEAAKNMDLVSNGVLTMAGQVGQSTKDLTSGLYMVESAGFHGADALNVLKTSAMGAKVGAADLSTVTDAVTTALNAYHMSAKDAVPTMNALVATESEGKTNMEALAGSMASILPVASAAHVGLNEVLGAMATMTAQGTSADVAATYLRQTIGQLSNPSAKAAATMKGLGLSAVDVSKELGSKGLAATLDTLTNAIKNKMGPDGTVLISTLQKASKNSKDFNGALQKMSGSQKTYIGALATMVGGTKSMMGALQLTGSHMSTFKSNVAGIADHVKKGGKSIEGWADVQKTFNQRMAEAKGSIEAVGIKIGQVLLPYATKMIGWLSTGVVWLTKHKSAVMVLAGAIGGVLVVGLTAAAVAAWNFAAGMLATGIPEIIIGVMALAGAIVYLATHWKQVWAWIKAEIPGVANVLKVTWNAVLGWLKTAWDVTMKAIHAIAKWFNDNVLKWLNDRVKDFSSWWKGHSAELKGTWDLLWKNVKLIANSVWAFLKVGIGELTTIFKVGWDIISGVVKTAWALISGAVQTGYHMVMNIIGILIDVLTGHWSKAWSDVKKLVSQAFSDIIHTIGSTVSNFGSMLYSAGSDLIHGLIKGVEGMAGAVGNAVSNIAHGALNTVKSVLGINSPSRVMRDEVGKWIPMGLAEGITSNAHHAHAAMTDTANGLVTSFSSALGIASPSKVFRSLGTWIHLGLEQGLTGSRSKVDSAIKHTETLLISAKNRLSDMLGTKAARGYNGYIKQHMKSITGLEKYVTREGKALDALANKRVSIGVRLKAAQKQLASIQKEWSKAQADVAKNIMQSASIVTQSGTPDIALTADNVLDNMRVQVGNANQFASELQTLAKKGLRSDLIKQIADAGVDGGGETARALAGASASQIKQLNSLQTQMSTAANGVGAGVADGMYGTGINAAKGLIKGLQSQEKAIDKQMLKIAKSMETQIKKALGIHSPSRLFHEIGQFVTSGLVNGIDAGNRDVQSAADRMSGAVLAGTKVPTLSGSAGSAGGHTVVVNVHVEGSVMADRDLTDTIQKVMARHGARNSQTWAAYRR
jgi:TP901 family phage tail tape measure protein